MSDVLQTILERKAVEVVEARRRLPLPELRERLAGVPAPRGFARAVRARTDAGRLAVIAEIKKASPSKGLIRADFDPAALAAEYAQGGAACLSVLTDRDFFQGAPEHLVAARAACSLPVLRKDFMLEPYQIYESRLLGADCVLLIVAALKLAEMQRLATVALELGMDLLVETHDYEEVKRALKLELPPERMLLGINNRNLRSFETALDTTLDLVPHIPGQHLVVSESGIYTRADVERLRAAGVRACLIGESLMRQPQPGRALAELLY